MIPLPLPLSHARVRTINEPRDKLTSIKRYMWRERKKSRDPIKYTKSETMRIHASDKLCIFNLFYSNRQVWKLLSFYSTFRLSIFLVASKSVLISLCVKLPNQIRFIHCSITREIIVCLFHIDTTCSDTNKSSSIFF